MYWQWKPLDRSGDRPEPASAFQPVANTHQLIVRQLLPSLRSEQDPLIDLPREGEERARLVQR